VNTNVSLLKSSTGRVTRMRGREVHTKF